MFNERKKLYILTRQAPAMNLLTSGGPSGITLGGRRPFCEAIQLPTKKQKFTRNMRKTLNRINLSRKFKILKNCP